MAKAKNVFPIQYLHEKRLPLFLFYTCITKPLCTLSETSDRNVFLDEKLKRI